LECCNTYHRNLKTFYNWLVEQKVVKKNPCLAIRLPNPKEDMVSKIINEEKLHQLFHTFRREQHKLRTAGKLNSLVQKKLWFKPLVTLAFYTGLRRKEIVQLQWSPCTW